MRLHALGLCSCAMVAVRDELQLLLQVEVSDGNSKP